MNNESLDGESNGDISINTNIKVFRGGLGLLNKNKQKGVKNKILDKEKEMISDKTKTEKIDSLKKQEKEATNEALSFRSQKEQFTLSNDRLAENAIIDSKILKKHICEKLNIQKQNPQKNLNEKEIIKKIFHKNAEEKELKVFEIGSDRFRNSSSDISSDEEIQSQKVELVNLNEDEKNIFWNLKNNMCEESSERSQRKRCKSVNNNKLHTNSTNNSFHNSTSSKLVSKITGTFSMLDKGKAVFVSSDDYIFVLPALFIPQNLVVGNTYMFKICEIDKLNNRMANLNDNIQKKYLKFGN
jgi:hypothetical protein